MGCTQSLSHERQAGVGATKKLPSSHTSRDSVVESTRSTPNARNAPMSGGAADRRCQHRIGEREQKQLRHRPRHDERTTPEAELPINWNLRFSELVVLEHIANGGYCTVLACLLNGEKRAVKIPLANCSDPEGAIADLTNEIRILKRMRHPHLCSVYGAGGWRTEGEIPFLVLERLQYENLSQQCGTETDDNSMRARLKQRRLRGKFTFRRRLGFGLELAELLRYLHSESIRDGFVIHRDLKPSNIGVSEDGVLKVFDFGLARLRERRDPLTDQYMMTGQTGSQRFMAPEVYDGMPYNEKADIYSYGVVLWELCSLRKPFGGMTSQEHARKVFRLGVRPPLDSKWPKELRNLLQDCWNSEPDERPHAYQIVEVLSGIIETMEKSTPSPFDKFCF